jgi:hypothetical protein
MLKPSSSELSFQKLEVIRFQNSIPIIINNCFNFCHRNFQFDVSHWHMFFPSSQLWTPGRLLKFLEEELYSFPEALKNQKANWPKKIALVLDLQYRNVKNYNLLELVETRKQIFSIFKKYGVEAIENGSCGVVGKVLG